MIVKYILCNKLYYDNFFYHLHIYNLRLGSFHKNMSINGVNVIYHIQLINIIISNCEI